jgi:hypothetical protein
MKKYFQNINSVFTKQTAIIVSLFSFTVYLFTIAPSVVQIDSGELATVQYLPGVAHPSGYPLFTILGYLFSHIPLGLSVIFKLNLLAAIYTSVAVYFFVKSAKIFLQFASITFSEKVTAAIVSVAGIELAFSQTFWAQSTSVEVYSLHILLLNAAIYFFLKALNSGTNKSWIIFASVLALGFSNHLTTFLLLPALAYLYFDKYHLSKSGLIKIVLMLLIFLPVILFFYSLLVFVASTSPKLNWGNVTNIDSLFRHVSGKQYQVWIFSSFDVLKKQLTYFLSHYLSEFGYFSVIPVLIGVATSWKNNKRIFFFLLLLFISTVIYASGYDIHDIDSYYLLAYIASVFFALFGLAFIYRKYFTKFNVLFFAGFLIIFPITEIVFNYHSVNQSGNYIFENYTKEALNSVQPNSIILTYQWDYFVSPSEYFRFVEYFRDDVAVVDKELLRRSWYYNQLDNNYPFVLKHLRKKVSDFLARVKPFEEGEKYNAQVLQENYSAIISGIIASNIQKHAVYIAPELVDNDLKQGEFTLPVGYTLVPDGFFYRVVKSGEYYAVRNLRVEIDFSQAENQYTNQIKTVVRTMILRRALYEMQNGKDHKAKKIISDFIRQFPRTPVPQVFMPLFK